MVIAIESVYTANLGDMQEPVKIIPLVKAAVIVFVPMKLVTACSNDETVVKSERVDVVRVAVLKLGTALLLPTPKGEHPTKFGALILTVAHCCKSNLMVSTA